MGSNGGTAYLWLGSATGLMSTAWTGYTGLSTSGFGLNVAGPGDLDGDGYAEFAVGAPTFDVWAGDGTELDDAGEVWIFTGNSRAAMSAGYVLSGDQPYGQLGQAFRVGDTNGDGYDDIAVGSSVYDDAATDDGHVALYMGGADGMWSTDPYARWAGGQAGAGLAAVSGTGDLDGDGAGELLLGAPGYDDAFTDGGLLFIVTGSPDADLDGHLTADDCDDGSDTIHPGATEIIGDGIDQDCDGQELCFTDADGDGDGDSTMLVSEDADCTDPGESGVNTDCDDDDDAIHLGATEGVADGVDQDCNGSEWCYRDGDRDDYGSTSTTVSADLDCTDLGESTDSSDCNDYTAAVNPAAAEVPGDGTDQNCDGIDGCFLDLDLDGYGTSDAIDSTDGDCADPGESYVSTDCDDADPDTSPAATEEVGDGIDQDCDGHDLCYADVDRDGHGGTVTRVSVGATCTGAAESSVSDDCDDAAATVYPGAAEVTADGIDQDCDEGDACYLDGDEDGFGSTATVASADLACDAMGESGRSDDCDDVSSAVYPDALETVGDGIDQDCDTHDTCYADVDRDGHGGTVTRVSVGATCTGSAESTLSDDCDDAMATVYPGAAEVTADGIDQDCDEGDSCYLDGDEDGFGSTATIGSVDLACDAAGESGRSDDCDDAQVTIYPGAEEIVADGVDQDCDDGDTCFVDGDGDHHGTAATLASVDLGCVGPGESPLSDDCDDREASVYTGATELVADGVDQDCDGGDDCWLDGDGDGHSGDESRASADLACDAPGEGTSPDDCDDSLATIYPGAEEIVADGIDQDCDDGDTCFVDADGDHHGTTATLASVDLGCAGPGESPLSDDCDDGEASVYMGATELVADGVDQDCDGGDDCWVDGDGDGHGGEETLASADLACDAPGEGTSPDDCDDSLATIHPGAEEIVADGVDQDCDEQEQCWSDTDQDGWGIEETVLGSLACDAPGEAAVTGDCDPGEPLIHPEALETVADGVDQDCDGGEVCYVDGDGDSFGGTDTVSSVNMACVDGGEAVNASDCDDAAASVFPGAAEVPDDGVDQNCDGADASTAGGDDDTGSGAEATTACAGCSGLGAAPGSAGILVLALVTARRRRRGAGRQGERVKAGANATRTDPAPQDADPR